MNSYHAAGNGLNWAEVTACIVAILDHFVQQSSEKDP